jgi:hypothetical protein
MGQENQILNKAMNESWGICTTGAPESVLP